jgi:gluconokinase
MKAHQPLDDADRAPWLAAVGRWIDGWLEAGSPGVIACSALKRAYRDELSRGRPQLRLVFLDGARDLIAARLAGRRGHFMPPDLLASQFADLEPPGPDERPIVVDIDQPVDAQADGVIAALAADPESETPWP